MGKIAEEIKQKLGTLVEVIPSDILASYSKEISNQKTALTRCSAVEDLVILSPSTLNDLAVYVNKERSHMLLISPTQEQVELVLSKCGSTLQRLSVESRQIQELNVIGVRGLRELRLSKV